MDSPCMHHRGPPSSATWMLLAMTLWTLTSGVSSASSSSSSASSMAPSLSSTSIPSTPGITYNELELERDSFVRNADVVLGILDIVYYVKTLDGVTYDKMNSARYFQYQSIVFWRLNQINRDTKLLPNVTLGYAVLVDRGNAQVALAKCIHFVRNRDICPDANLSPYDVSSVISLSYSSSTILAANLLRIYELPLVSVWATSEELNNVRKYPYYARNAPSDLFQARAIVDILVKYNWTYVALIVDEGNYGMNLAKAITEYSSDKDICFPLHIITNDRENIEDPNMIADKIVGDKEIKIVIGVVFDTTAHEMSKAVYEHPKRDRNIIYIFCDAISAFYRLDIGAKYILDSFVIRMYGNYMPDTFYEQFELTKGSTTDNPWIPKLYEQTFNCSWTDQRWAPCNQDMYINELASYSRSHLGTLISDCVDALANAFHLHFERTCPEVFKGGYSSGYIRECAKTDSEGLMRLVKISMAKYPGQYMISQYQQNSNTSKYFLKNVGTWRLDNLSLIFRDEDIAWTDLPRYGISSVQLEGNATLTVPRSKCSRPCLEKQYALAMPLKCCWECRYCAVNEILVKNHTGCTACPYLYWPDSLTNTECHVIPATYFRSNSMTTRLVVGFSVLGVLVSLAILLFFIKNRQVRIIKATGFKISILSQVGVTIEYISAIVLIWPPTLGSCYLGYILMNLGFCIIFSSLLMKTNRIYRIFNAAKSSASIPNFTKDKHLLIIINIMVFIQIVIIYVTYLQYPPKLEMKMKSPIEYFVELACFTSTICFLLPISYNISILLVCCFYTIKIRKLPDNFNESKLIFLHVVSTVFLSVAFTPTYINAEREKQKTSLLCMLMLISGYLSNICLHVPKIYAILCTDEIGQEGGSSVGITIKSAPRTQTSTGTE